MGRGFLTQLGTTAKMGNKEASAPLRKAKLHVAEGRLVSQVASGGLCSFHSVMFQRTYWSPALFQAQRCVTGRETLATVATGGLWQPTKGEAGGRAHRTAEMLEGAVQ